MRVKDAWRWLSAFVRYVFRVAVVGPAAMLAALLFAASVTGMHPLDRVFEAVYSWRTEAPVGYVRVIHCDDEGSPPVVSVPGCKSPRTEDITVAEAARDAANGVFLLYGIAVVFSTIICLAIGRPRQAVLTHEGERDGEDQEA